MLVGLRVAFWKHLEIYSPSFLSIGGAMADYFMTSASQCIPLDDDMSFDQAATFIINPLSCLALLDRAK